MNLKTLAYYMLYVPLQLNKLLLNRRGTEKPVRPCGSPTCTPTGKQATRSVSPLGEATGAALRGYLKSVLKV